MVDQEHPIAAAVRRAKEDGEAADRLIRDCLPFIRGETARFLGRAPDEERDDEFSIAMMAFYEAIRGYSRGRGAFFPYAALTIRSRLIDYRRSQARHGGALSLQRLEEGEEEDSPRELSDGRDHQGEWLQREATQEEIAGLRRELEGFGVGFSDVAENCPRQQRTLEACRRALRYGVEHPEILEELTRTRRLPLGKLAAGSGVERKTLERHRDYLVALLLIQTNGFEIIRGHICQVLKGGTGR